MTYKGFLLFVCVCSAVTTINGQFEVPDANVEVFAPKGLRVSIPDEEGIQLFAFHAKVNEEMNGREGGYFSRDITKAKDGRWTFYDPQARLNIGDTLYYWTFVDYFDGERKLGYTKDDQSFRVTELLPKPTGNQGNPNKGQGNPNKGPGHNKGNQGQGHGNGNQGQGHGNQGHGNSGEIFQTTKKTPVPIDVDIRISSPSPPDVCRPSVTTVKGQQSCQGKLIFDSEFSRFQEDKDKYWTIQRKFSTGPDYEFVVYEDNPRTLSAHDGHLVISPVLTDEIYGEGFVTQPTGLDLGEHCTGTRSSPECYQKPDSWFIIPPVVSSQIFTKGKFSFKYGKIQIRAKVPKGDWLYPELFLNSENGEYGPSYESGQIRVAFVAGNQRDNQKLEGGLILGAKTPARKYAIKSTESGVPWTDAFHNYTVEWTPAGITLSVDGSEYGKIYPPEGGFASLASNLQLKNADSWKRGNNMAPFDKEMHIVIGVGAGGHNFEDRTDGTKPWANNKAISQKDFYKARTAWRPTWGSGAALDVEYVKVWALNT